MFFNYCFWDEEKDDQINIVYFISKIYKKLCCFFFSIILTYNIFILVEVNKLSYIQ